MNTNLILSEIHHNYLYCKNQSTNNVIRNADGKGIDFSNSQ